MTVTLPIPNAKSVADALRELADVLEPLELTVEHVSLVPDEAGGYRADVIQTELSNEEIEAHVQQMAADNAPKKRKASKREPTTRTKRT